MAAIHVVLGDVTAPEVDAIVAAANESLLCGVASMAPPDGGAAAGRSGRGDGLLCARRRDAYTAFSLDPPVRHVIHIHTVGPVWEGGSYSEASILASCYRRNLQVVGQVGARSLAFPAIATGVCGSREIRPRGSPWTPSEPRRPPSARSR